MNLPTFTPDHIGEVDHKAELSGSVSSEECLGQKWIGERWIGYIGREGEPPVEGRWFPEDGRWRFVSKKLESLDFQRGQALQLYDGYWGERAYIVLAGLAWTEGRFVAKKEWDHDHCGICWATISPNAPQYYRSSERDIVCPDCYKSFVLLRSLSFIELTPNNRMESNG